MIVDLRYALNQLRPIISNCHCSESSCQTCDRAQRAIDAIERGIARADESADKPEPNFWKITERLLNSAELCQDDLEPETIEAIDQAQEAIERAVVGGADFPIPQRLAEMAQAGDDTEADIEETLANMAADDEREARRRDRER